MSLSNVDTILESIKNSTHDMFNNPSFADSMNDWDKYGFTCKDISGDELLKVKELNGISDNTLSFLCDGGINIECNAKKDKKFFELWFGQSFKDSVELIGFLKPIVEESKTWFIDNDISVRCIKSDKGLISGSLLQAYLDCKRDEFFSEIKNCKKVYKATIQDKNMGGFIAIVDGLETFLPGSLAAANKILDFDTYIGKEINVMLEDHIKDGDTFIVSHKKYIQNILPQRMAELSFSDMYEGEITGVAKFGLFIEIDQLFTGLLHVSEMTIETKDKLDNEGFLPGDKVKVYIKEISKANKIILTEFKDRIVYSINDFKRDCENKVCMGTIKNTKVYGVFVEFVVEGSSFIGLLHKNDIDRYFENFRIGAPIECFIENINVDDNKITLKLPQ